MAGMQITQEQLSAKDVKILTLGLFFAAWRDRIYKALDIIVPYIICISAIPGGHNLASLNKMVKIS
jgi:hypothetical protein